MFACVYKVRSRPLSSGVSWHRLEFRWIENNYRRQWQQWNHRLISRLWSVNHKPPTQLQRSPVLKISHWFLTSIF